MNYILQEIQTTRGVTALSTPIIYPTREAAESAFYTTCGFAVISQVEVHTVMVYNEAGATISELCKCFHHMTPEEMEPAAGETGD